MLGGEAGKVNDAAKLAAPTLHCHSERSGWFAKRTSHAVEGSLVRPMHRGLCEAFLPHDDISRGYVIRANSHPGLLKDYDHGWADLRQL